MKKTSVKDLVRQGERENRTAQRQFDRDIRELDAEEIRLTNQIRALARKGDKTSCTILAKQLVKLRQQRTRNYACKAQMNSIAYQQRTAASTMAMGGAMKSTSNIMHKMNKDMDKQNITKVLNQMNQEKMKMDHASEMTDNAFASLFDDDEQEIDDAVERVLDQIGIEITDKMANAPSVGRDPLSAPAHVDPVADIEAQLAQLR